MNQLSQLSYEEEVANKLIRLASAYHAERHGIINLSLRLNDGNAAMSLLNEESGVLRCHRYSLPRPF